MTWEREREKTFEGQNQKKTSQSKLFDLDRWWIDKDRTINKSIYSVYIRYPTRLIRHHTNNIFGINYFNSNLNLSLSLLDFPIYFHSIHWRFDPNEKGQCMLIMYLYVYYLVVCVCFSIWLYIDIYCIFSIDWEIFLYSVQYIYLFLVILFLFSPLSLFSLNFLACFSLLLVFMLWCSTPHCPLMVGLDFDGMAFCRVQ